MSEHDPFAAVEKLLAMVPLARLQCPQCGARDEFELGYTIDFTATLDWDGPSKLITVDYSTEEIRRRIEEFVICTLCTHEFPIPEGWKITNPYNKPKKRPSLTGARAVLPTAEEIREADEKKAQAQAKQQLIRKRREERELERKRTYNILPDGYMKKKGSKH